MKNKMVVNGLEIEYDDILLEKIRMAAGKSPFEEISQSEIVDFLKESFKNAINKGYGIVE